MCGRSERCERKLRHRRKWSSLKVFEREAKGMVEGISFFFFLAEDGIRDVAVTGVQTCALPIYKQADSVLFTTQVATGSGKILEKEGGSHWKFETPRGRLLVQSKEEDPAWVPPDWHFVEQARKRGLGLVRLNRGEEIPSGGGWAIAVAGSNVVRRYPDGRETPIETGEDREIVVGGNIIIPPFGTNQRKYKGVLGTHRLNLGDGYALHGTNKPETVGRSVSHGCVRLRNEDIAKLYEIVPVGTAVFIY